MRPHEAGFKGEGTRSNPEVLGEGGKGKPTCGNGKAQRGPGALLSDAIYTIRAMLANS